MFAATPRRRRISHEMSTLPQWRHKSLEVTAQSGSSYWLAAPTLPLTNRKWGQSEQKEKELKMQTAKFE